MKVQAFGALFSLLAAASAAPVTSVSNQLSLSSKQLQSLLSVLAAHDVASTQQVEQSISCAVAYTLALSDGPPYSIELSTLDLSNCTYTGP
ncbi:hypothetical protein N7532_003343 [Penicillium argentinense]|uniref:Uncharacterized protein n=1 Tax=Penicillium argentinense TaxID=1131581 RepID=A0A9W9FMC4_9EURO|nr:uncharacterized protein N7532_003343 [Penicillium argentinense]KAJ5102814.1 hypothetical protein N7532_003343 [Penicillium argentinense]